MNLPPFPSYPILSNSNILLKEIEFKDLDSIISITSYNRILAKDKIDAWDKIKKINQDYNNGKSIHWGIYDQKTNKIIGTCGYYRGFENNRGELGCILLPDFRGKDITKIALQLVIEFGYKTLKLEEIFAITNKTNTQAIKLLEKLNFDYTKNIHDLDLEMTHKKSD